MNKQNITSIRILPNDKGTFSKESEFRYFIENTMVIRGGKYYFPNLMMNCPINTFVLFQYDGMIRAIGILIDLCKIPVIDEHRMEYAGYYKFDTDTLEYLDMPINREMLKTVYPNFNSFNQSKQIIPLEYLDDILELLENINSISWNNESNIIPKIENTHIKPWEKSEAKEKLDVNNGLLLCPNHDKLFDGGWISFDNDGKILISGEMKTNDKIFMNIREDMKIVLTKKNKSYMKYHREHIFRG